MVMRYVTLVLLFIVCIGVVSGTSYCIKPVIHIFDGQKLGCDRTKIHEIDFFIKPRQKTTISVLENERGKKFIVKQRFEGYLSEHLGIVCETIGVLLAQSAGILANSIDIIPAFYDFPGKRIRNLPATLHTFVPGYQVSKLPSSLRKFYVKVKQWVNDNLPKNERGLTRDVIYNMAKHNDLPFLVAVDTFVANGGRSGNNLFYDRDSDHYFAIDFGSCYKKNVALYACDAIQLMIEDKSVTFSKQEMRALRLYRDTLARLITLYTAEGVHKKFVICVLEAGFMSQETQAELAAALLFYKKVMIENYESCKQLVVLLDELIMKHK